MMPRCPECGKEISYLVNYVSNITEKFTFTVSDRGEPEYEYVDTYSFGSESVYVCPVCDEELFANEEEAIKFLRRR